MDRYELLAPIGKGGFGQVWLARLRGKRQFEKLVAIKVPRFGDDVHVEQMLLDEARITAAIDHENVVRILDFGEVRGSVYIVMEWVDGEPLSALLRELRKRNIAVPFAVALRIVSDLCGAAHAAHELRGSDGRELGVVHRDISPENALLTRTGRVKLIDFGVAKARERAVDETRWGTTKGKPKYMGPEQVLGARVDRRTDVFALGAVLFELVVGHAPYEAGSSLDTVRRLSRGPDVRVPEYVPTFVRQILEKALARSPDARFGTALDMQHALMAAMAVMEPLSTRARIAALVREHLHDSMDCRRTVVDVGGRSGDRRTQYWDGAGELSTEFHIPIEIGDAMDGLDSRPVGTTSIEIPIEVSYVSETAGTVIAPAVIANENRPSRTARSVSASKRWPLWIAAFNLCLFGIGILAVQTRSRTAPKVSATCFMTEAGRAGAALDRCPSKVGPR